MIFDTHAHYDDEAFQEDRDELLMQMNEKGIRYITNVGASLSGVAATYELMQRYDFIYGALGVHPDEVGELTEEKLVWLEELLAHEKAVAVGEIGLDYYWDKEPREEQKKWFIRQLQLACKLNKPVNIHSRDAAQDTFDILKEYHAKQEGFAGGIIHCYSGSVEMAREYVKLGYHIGVGGVVTFKNAKVLKEVVKEVPLERIVTETDCPYLAPTPHRGKRNCSLYIPFIIEEIARIKGVEPEEAEAVLFANACRVYHING